MPQNLKNIKKKKMFFFWMHASIQNFYIAILLGY